MPTSCLVRFTWVPRPALTLTTRRPKLSTSYYGTTEYGKTSGDVMINWLYNAPNGGNGGTILNRPADNSFSNFSYGSYGNFAIAHELGHSLGLVARRSSTTPATAGPITYAKDAYFYQDSNSTRS